MIGAILLQTGGQEKLSELTSYLKNEERGSKVKIREEKAFQAEERP